MKRNRLSGKNQGIRILSLALAMISIIGCLRTTEPRDLKPSAKLKQPACVDSDHSAQGLVAIQSDGTPTTLVLRAEELPFCYERGETGSAWPSKTTGGKAIRSSSTFRAEATTAKQSVYGLAPALATARSPVRSMEGAVISPAMTGGFISGWEVPITLTGSMCTGLMARSRRATTCLPGVLSPGPRGASF